MPHSSGGCSHGGGSHGGSHGGGHHGGRSGGSSSRISHSPFAGASRYRYRHHGQYRYFYTNRQPGKLFSKARLLLGIFYIPFLIAIGFMFKQAIGNPFKSYKPTTLIKDDAHVLTETAGLSNALENFYEKSGIPTAVITVYNEEWNRSFVTLEEYAYERYLIEFDDEMHWLILYSQPMQPDPNDVDWFCEGMQGNDTDDVLTERVTARFNDDLNMRLESIEGNVEEDIAQALNNAAGTVKKRGIGSVLRGLVPALFMLAFICFHAYFMLGLNEFKYRNAELAPEDDSVPQPYPAQQTPVQPAVPQQVVCRYCGTTQNTAQGYCQNCGASLAEYQANPYANNEYYHSDNE